MVRLQRKIVSRIRLLTMGHVSYFHLQVGVIGKTITLVYTKCLNLLDPC